MAFNEQQIAEIEKALNAAGVPLRLLSAEAARIYRVDDTTIRRWVRDDALPAARLPRPKNVQQKPKKNGEPRKPRESYRISSLVIMENLKMSVEEFIRLYKRTNQS